MDFYPPFGSAGKITFVTTVGPVLDIQTVLDLEILDGFRVEVPPCFPGIKFGWVTVPPYFIFSVPDLPFTVQDPSNLVFLPPAALVSVR